MSSDHSSLIKRLQRALREVQLVRGAEIPPAALEDFYKDVFPERASFLKQNWRWLYAGAGADIASPIVAMVGDQIVGHGGLIPVALRRQAEQRTAIWMVDFAVRPEYQRGLIGGGLVLAGMSACPLRVAFLNERSWKMVAKLGWQDRLGTTAFQLLLRPEHHPRVQALASKHKPLGLLACLAGQATRVLARVRTAIPVTASSISPDNLATFSAPDSVAALQAPRSEQFLQWRLLNHPHQSEYVLFEAEARGYQAVARILDQPQGRRLHILALRTNTQSAQTLSRFLAGIIRWAAKNDVSQVVLVTSDPAVAQVAKWWFPHRNAQRFAFHAEAEADRAFLGNDEQRWELLDGDFEMMFESR